MSEFPHHERISEALNEAERSGLVRFLKTLDSESIDSYLNTIDLYIWFCTDKDLDFRGYESVLQFCYHLHADGEGFAPTTIWSKQACVAGLFQSIGLGDPKEKHPLLGKTLKAWSKSTSKKKAKTFTKDEVLRYFVIAGAEHEPWQRAATAVMIATVARTGDIVEQTWEHVRRINEGYIFGVFRVKSDKGEKGDYQDVLITNKVFVDAIDKYIQLFKKEEWRCGRFFMYFDKKMQPKKNGQVGHNRFAELPSKVALALGYTDAESKLYTGHSFRRTAASLLAESGLSMILLKIAGNWSSDKAAQGYIDTSMGTKRSIAGAFSFDEKEERSKRQRSEEKDHTTPSNVTFNITCGSNCVFNLPGK